MCRMRGGGNASLLQMSQLVAPPLKILLMISLIRIEIDCAFLVGVPLTQKSNQHLGLFGSPGGAKGARGAQRLPLLRDLCSFCSLFKATAQKDAGAQESETSWDGIFRDGASAEPHVPACLDT